MQATSRCGGARRYDQSAAPPVSVDSRAVAERVIESEAVEEPAGQGNALSTDVRPVLDRRSADELDSWRGEVRAIAVVAAGGIAAGAATVAALSVARRSSARSRMIRRVGGGNRDGIVASRSFLVDVHVLGR